MKLVKKVILGLALVGLVCFGAAGALEMYRHAFSADGLLKVDASDLKRTVVSPHRESPVVSNRNVVWCASFQLAWNEACALVGEKLRFGDHEPVMVAALNQQSFTRQDIDAESYVAVAGFVKDDITGEIERQLKGKFDGRAEPRYLPPKALTPRPRDIVAYAYLFKNLEFSVPFERIERPIVFGTESLPCFGIGEEFRHQHYEMVEQVLIRDYRSEDDFVVELKTKGQQDELILAKLPPEGTLDETIRAVQTRIAHAEPALAELGDILKVPKLNFDITRHYDELEGKQLVVENPEIAADLFLLSALQNIRFQLDEEGVRLRSESHMAFGCAAAPDPPPQRHVMVFDKPFLVMLQRSGADVPYFALWVENPELLVRGDM